MRKIDLSAWPRRELYELFSQCDWPFYALSFPLDVTRLRAYTRRSGLSFYYTLVWLLTRGMQQQEAFRLRIRAGELFVMDELLASCTDLQPGAEVFRFLTLPARGAPEDFCRRAKELAGAQKTLFDSVMEARDDVVYFSCLPWLPVLSLTNERRTDPDDCIPRVGWGRYQEENGRLMLPVCLEVNHRTVDGLHIGRLYEWTQCEINKL